MRADGGHQADRDYSSEMAIPPYSADDHPQRVREGGKKASEAPKFGLPVQGKLRSRPQEDSSEEGAAKVDQVPPYTATTVAKSRGTNGWTAMAEEVRSLRPFARREWKEELSVVVGPRISMMVVQNRGKSVQRATEVKVDCPQDDLVKRNSHRHSGSGLSSPLKENVSMVASIHDHPRSAALGKVV